MFEKLKGTLEYTKGKKPILIEYSNEDTLPYLSAEYLRNNKLESYVDKKNIDSKYHCNSDDLLIIWDGSNSGEVFMGKSGILSSTMAKLKIKDKKYTNKYLYYFLKQKFSILNEKVTGAAIPHLNKAVLENLEIYPATQSEQQEIVQVLDTMSNIIRLREECITHAQDLIPALFQEMFDNPQTNKKNWQICCLKDLAKIDRQNISPEELKTKQYTYIGLEHIEKETGRILVDPNSQQDIDLKSNKFFFTNNHVLYGKLRPYLNKVALPDFDGVCSTDIFPLLPLEGISNKYFLKVLMNTSYFVNIANSQSSGANLPRIGTTALENIKVFKPDYTLQEQFAQKAIEIESYIKEQNEELENAKQMFQSLLHHAFTGELTKSNVVDLLTRQVALHSKIIDKCNSHQTFGAVKLEKIFNLCDMIQELNLVPNGYYRKAAGPYVPEMRHTVEQELLQNNWVKITNQGNGKKVEYKKDSNFTAYKAIYNQIFNDKNQEIENIINYFYDKDTNYCEAFSTLYMCWNDLILEGENPTKTEIIDEFKNHWAPEKQRFERIYLLEILSDMSNQGFEPQGHGVHTIESNYNHNKDQLSLQLK